MSNQTTAVTLKSMLGNDNVKARFQEILGKKAPGFISSILSVANSNTLLQKADPKTVMNAAVIAATLDLPINPNLGFAYIVPYGNQGSFQLGYKGLIQLCMRSGQYSKIEVNEVYEGEIKIKNRFTGEYEFNEPTSDKLVGVLAYFKLTNGFEKYLYMSKEECEAHGKKYSQTFKRGSGLWSTEFWAMAKKTCLKLLLSKYGILSIEMQRAQTFDQSVVKNDLIQEDVDTADIEYADNANTATVRRDAIKSALEDAQIVDTETGEVLNG